MADAQVLKTCKATCEGSTPSRPTMPEPEITDEQARSIYSKNGPLKDWITINDKKTLDFENFRSKRLSEIIVARELTKIDGVVKILSPSSNSGLMENKLQTLLGNTYSISTSDFADLKQVYADDHVRTDARHLPYPSGSFSAIMDNFGATWHACTGDNQHTKVREVFSEFFRVLVPSGVIMVDGQTMDRLKEIKELKLDDHYDIESEVMSEEIDSKVYFIKQKVS